MPYGSKALRIGQSDGARKHSAAVAPLNMFTLTDATSNAAGS